MMKKQHFGAIGFALFLMLNLQVRAQWITQAVNLKPGWNAVYLHVDPSYDTLANTVAADASNPILEVWLWAVSSAPSQFVNTPAAPTESYQWVSWSRSAQAPQLQRLSGNSAYMVKVGTNVSSYTWNIKGKVVPPDYHWTTTGLNLIGFPTPTSAPPKFDAFLSKSSDLQGAEIYQYVGGDLNANNPVRVAAFRTTPVLRGQAYWVRSGDVFNHYYGPFSLALSGSGSGLNFSSNLVTRSFRLANLTASSVTVTLSLVGSEAAPSGEATIVGIPPLIVRERLNTTNLTYGATTLSTTKPYSLVLAPKGLAGSESEVVLGLSRSAMAIYPPGDLVSGILRMTDALGQSQVDMPVCATASSTAGLWVGSVAVTQVGEYLRTYQSDLQGGYAVNTNGQYILTGINTNLGSVARPYPLRLIVHNPASGSARLLQHVFYGPDANTNNIVATQESFLNHRFLSQARRISSAQFPWSAENQGWALSGNLAPGATVTAIVPLDYRDQASNPFLHSYHPDHDNLDVTFKNALPQGSESYSVQRTITLAVTPGGSDFASLTTAGQTLNGNYLETIALQGLARAGGTNDTRQFQVRGSFSLNRISDISTLTTP